MEDDEKKPYVVCFYRSADEIGYSGFLGGSVIWAENVFEAADLARQHHPELSGQYVTVRLAGA